MRFGSTEAAFQAAKCKSLDDRKAFIGKTPAEAKKLGRKVSLREDWDDCKVDVMREILLLKFCSPTEESKMLAKKLVSTGDAELIEGNYWHDTFWGICNGEGENHLGKLLMEIREMLNPCGFQNALKENVSPVEVFGNEK